MKMSPITVVLVSVASSLATVGSMELLRGTPGSRPALAIEASPASSVQGTPPEVEALAPVAPSAAPRTEHESLPLETDREERLAELERRIAALELRSTSRAPVASTAEEPPPREELRDLVLDWVAKDREARWQAEELEEEEERRRELEFEARHQAFMLAQEHGLARWQQEEFAKLFLEMAVRAEEIERSIDVLTDDPEDVEARWTEYDEWVDRRERELTALLDPVLYEKIYGED